jgi:hypothetical protein
MFRDTYPIKLSENAKAPMRIDPMKAEYEVYSADDFVIIPGNGGMAIVDTGVFFNPNEKCELGDIFVLPRVTPLWDLVKTHYVYAVDGNFGSVGETLKIMLVNNSPTSYIVKHRTPIANIIFEMVITPNIEII